MPTRALPPASLTVGGLTLIGFLIRLAGFDQSLFADELSTYWILDGNSLGEVLSSVRSDDEITPPLYFVLAWLSLQVGPDPEWVRLPSLLAGTATIPLIYLLGARCVGRAAGLIAAAVFALSPFMIHYAVEARSYAVMIALLTASTLALLLATESGRARWWGAYAACSCAAMLSHYTSLFPLAAQALWAVWAHREAIRPLLLANLAALIAFLPWLPGFAADTDSPTTQILSALSPFELDAVRFAIEQWAVGFPNLPLRTVPGRLAGILAAAGLLIAIGAGAWRGVRWLKSSGTGAMQTLRAVPAGVVLVALLLLSTPVGEAIYSALGPNLLGARNLNASWPALAIALGAIVVAAGPRLAGPCALLLLSGFGIAATKTLDPDVARVDYAAAAKLIEERSAPGDVVADASTLTPVPLTGLDLYLADRYRQFRLGLPVSDEPFKIGDPVPPQNRLIAEAYQAAEGGSVFLVALPDLETATGQVANLLGRKQNLANRLRRRAPPGFEETETTTLAGVIPLVVIRIQDRRPAAGDDRGER
jgi:hypothetical protein